MWRLGGCGGSAIQSQISPLCAWPHLWPGPAVGLRGGGRVASESAVGRPQNWRIARIDLMAGSIEPEMGGTVGRVGMRPAVSPDARYLAYATSSGHASACGCATSRPTRNGGSCRRGWMTHRLAAGTKHAISSRVTHLRRTPGRSLQHTGARYIASTWRQGARSSYHLQLMSSARSARSRCTSSTFPIRQCVPGV